MMKKQSRRGIERAVLVATVLTLGCGAIAACDGAGDDDAASGGDGGALDGTTGPSDGTSPVGPDGALGVDSGPGEGLDGSTPGDDGGPTSHDGGGDDDDDGGELADGGGDEDDGGPIPVVTCTRTFGDGVSRNLVHSIDVDGRGNIVFAGTLYGTVDFGGGPLTSMGSSDAFLVKLNNRCNHVFSKRLGDATAQEAPIVRVGSDGSIYFATITRGTVDFGLGPMSNGGARFSAIVKFSKDGVAQWGIPLKSPAREVLVTAMTIDENDHLFFGGASSPDDIAGQPTAAAAAFFASVDANGAYRWAKTATSAQPISPVGVLSARIQGADVWFSGRTQFDLDFGEGAIDRPRWGWIYRLGRDGTAIAVHSFDGVSIELSRLGARPYAFGSPNTTDVDLGTGPLNATDIDGGKIAPYSFIASWNSDGTGAQWIKAYGRKGASPDLREAYDMNELGETVIASIGPSYGYSSFAPDGGAGSGAGLPGAGQQPASGIAPTNQFVAAGKYIIGADAERVRVVKGTQRVMP